jgi:hypothetical protein
VRCIYNILRNNIIRKRVRLRSLSERVEEVQWKAYLDASFASSSFRSLVDSEDTRTPPFAASSSEHCTGVPRRAGLPVGAGVEGVEGEAVAAAAFWAARRAKCPPAWDMGGRMPSGSYAAPTAASRSLGPEGEEEEAVAAVGVKEERGVDDFRT